MKIVEIEENSIKLKFKYTTNYVFVSKIITCKNINNEFFIKSNREDGIPYFI